MRGSAKVPPHNLQAEESLLGAALLSPAAMEIAVTQLESADFYKPMHAVIHQAFTRVWSRDVRKVDAVIIADEISAMGAMDNIGGPTTLIGLQSNTPATSNADRYAAIIQEKSLMRRMAIAGDAITEMGFDDSAWANDPSAAINKARSLVNDLEMPIGAVEPSPNIEEFMAIHVKQDWLVEGLLERGDRVIITGEEGGGKSTMMRSLAVQFAAGIHPWESRLVKPIKVLIIDVENSGPQVQRSLRGLKIQAGEHLEPDNLRVEVRTEGLDLLSKHDVRWLIERVAAARPDLITIGPIYKLHTDDPNEEKPARKVAQVLDNLRAHFGCSLLIEAHSPHGSTAKRPLRPFGASLWMRWPEFGYGLRQTKADPTRYLFETWRGPRDLRDWPKAVRRGGRWPWMKA